jgi:hypothetical protein
MTSEPLKEVYKTPRAQVRGVFLCDSVMNCQSPVRGVTLEAWDEVTPETGKDFEDLSFQIW